MNNTEIKSYLHKMLTARRVAVAVNDMTDISFETNELFINLLKQVSKESSNPLYNLLNCENFQMVKNVQEIDPDCPLVYFSYFQGGPFNINSEDLILKNSSIPNHQTIFGNFINQDGNMILNLNYKISINRKKIRIQSPTFNETFYAEDGLFVRGEDL